MHNVYNSSRSDLLTAVVFGASGAIGGAVVAALQQDKRFGTIYTGTRHAPRLQTASSHTFQFDLTDEASIATAARSLASPPDLVFVATGLLHNDADGIKPEKSWTMIDPTAMNLVYAINAVGPALIAKHFVPLLPKNRRAVFAVLSARVGSISDNHLGGWYAYRASKAALNMIVKNLAIELARTRPLAIAAALHPGTVDSQLSQPFQRNVLPQKLNPPDLAARNLLTVLNSLTPTESGGLYAWDGSKIPA